MFLNVRTTGVPIITVSGCVQPGHVLQCMKGEQQSAGQPSSSPVSQPHDVTSSLKRHLSMRKHGIVDNAITMQANNTDKYFIVCLDFIPVQRYRLFINVQKIKSLPYVPHAVIFDILSCGMRIGSGRLARTYTLVTQDVSLRKLKGRLLRRRRRPLASCRLSGVFSSFILFPGNVPVGMLRAIVLRSACAAVSQAEGVGIIHCAVYSVKSSFDEFCRHAAFVGRFKRECYPEGGGLLVAEPRVIVFVAQQHRRAVTQ